MLAAQDTQLEFALGQSLRTGHRPLLNATMPKAGVHQLAHVLFELASGTQLLLNLVIRERLVDVAVFHGAQLHLPTAAQELVPQGHFDTGNRQNFIRDGGNTGPAQLDFFSHQRLSLGQLEFLGIVSASAIDLVPSDFASRVPQAQLRALAGGQALLPPYLFSPGSTIASALSDHAVNQGPVFATHM